MKYQMTRIARFFLSVIVFSLTGVVDAQAPDIPVLIEQLRESKDIYQRRQAAKALGEITAQPREMMLEVAAALLQASVDMEDESLQYYAKNGLKRVRLSVEDAFNLWINIPEASLGNWVGEAAVPQLCESLNKPHNLGHRHDSYLRYQTAYELIHLGPSMPDVAVPALIKALRNPTFARHGDDYSRAFPRKVVLALGAIGEPAIEDLLDLLCDESACYLASTALSVMQPEPPETIVPALLDILVHGDQHSQLAVMEVLEHIGESAKDSVLLLIDLLSDNSPSSFRYMKLQAARTLGAMGPASAAAVPALLEVLNDPLADFHKIDAALTRSSVLDALGNIGPAAQVGLPKIQKALEDNDIMVRSAAISALRKLNAPLSASQIKELCFDESGFISYQALVEIGKLPPPFQDEAISVLLESGQILNAAWILAQIGQPAVPALLNALTAPSIDVRQIGARALSEMESLPPHALEALIKAMQAPEICFHAAEGLARMDSEQALSAVKATLIHENAKIRFAGAAALAQLEFPPQETVKALIVVLADKHEPVHRNAVIALRKIGTPEALKAVDRVELGLK